MQSTEEMLVISLTRQEAEELYYQCLKRTDPDTDAGSSIFHKLATTLQFEI